MINMVLYIVYLLFVSLVFSFAFPLFLQLIGQEIIHPADPIYVKIQVFLAILVLLVSLIFRKFFYISLKSEDEVVEVTETKASYTETKKVEEAEKKAPTKISKKAKTKKQEQRDEDGIKIYVEKEIK